MIGCNPEDFEKVGGDARDRRARQSRARRLLLRLATLTVFMMMVLVFVMCCFRCTSTFGGRGGDTR